MLSRRRPVSGRYSRTVSVDQHVKQRISRSFGRRPRRPSKSFSYKVLRAITPPLAVQYEVNKVYANKQGSISTQVETIQFSRTICNKPMLERMQAAIQANATTAAGAGGIHEDSVANPFIIESASCVTTLRNDSTCHITVVVYEVVPRENTRTCRQSGGLAAFDEYDEAENTMCLFRARRHITQLDNFFINGGVLSDGQEVITEATTVAAAPVAAANYTINTITSPFKMLPLSYGPFDCPELVALYKFSKPKTVTLAPDGTLTLRLARNVPKRWNPEVNQSFENWDPYDFRNLTRTHFIRILPEKHISTVAIPDFTLALHIDPITVSTNSVYRFQVRSPYENRPLKVKADLSMVGAGLQMQQTGGYTTTFATMHSQVASQGNVSIPVHP